jgi:phosphopantothenoylcysteine decarboxylase/phosphopantothenate--cysteine ligase
MASITIRGLDDDLKQRLRLRAARNGRSMEDEARTILRGVDRVDPPQVSRHPAASAAPQPEAEPAGRRVLLIIGGGIAAYKSLDLIRRLQDRGLTVRCVLTAAAQFITPLAADAQRRAGSPTCSIRQAARCRPYPVGARCRSGGGGAGDRRSDGQDGERPCR